MGAIGRPPLGTVNSDASSAAAWHACCTSFTGASLCGDAECDVVNERDAIDLDPASHPSNNAGNNDDDVDPSRHRPGR